jgi:uncharacterized iron-regulated membrane protein
VPTIPFHAPGITYNGLHATTSPTAAQVAADLATTRQHFSHVRTYYPQYGGGAVDVGKTGAWGREAPPDLPIFGGTAVVLAASDARVLAVHDARHAGWGAKSLGVVRALHVGELGGTPVRFIYVLGGLASVTLACSGYVLAVARPGRVRKARAASP